jgi:protein tyrosine phosphatase (PTP) superfamily phosphohydrolase (DUF442 family)
MRTLLIVLTIPLFVSFLGFDEGFRLMKYKNFYISRQPTKEDVSHFKNKKIDLVINVRSREEMKSVEPFDFAKYGAQTEIIRPILQNGEFSVASYASIENAIEKYKGKNILIFCSSGNRAAATLAIYLNKKQGMAPQKAVDTVIPVGLTKSGLREKLLEFLRK